MCHQCPPEWTLPIRRIYHYEREQTIEEMGRFSERIHEVRNHLTKKTMCLIEFYQYCTLHHSIFMYDGEWREFMDRTSKQGEIYVENMITNDEILERYREVLRLTIQAFRIMVF